MKKLSQLLIAGAALLLTLTGCQNAAESTTTVTESAVFAWLSASDSADYQIEYPFGKSLSDTKYTVTLEGGITMSDAFCTALHSAYLSGETITDVSPYFSVSMGNVTGYKAEILPADIISSDLVEGTSFTFTLVSEEDGYMKAPSFQSGYIRVNLAGNALANNNGKGLTTVVSKYATYVVGQYASITQKATAYTINNTYYTNTVTVVLNDSINVTDWHYENGYPKSDKVESWLTLPSVTDAKFMSEKISTTNVSNDTITYVISGSTGNTKIDTSDVQLAIPSTYLTYYAKYSTTDTVPMLSSLTSSVKTIPAAAAWCFINPYVNWDSNRHITLTGTNTYTGTAVIYVTGDTFKESTVTGSIKPKFAFYTAKDDKATTDIVFDSDGWETTAGATSGTLTYQIKAAANSESEVDAYYALVTFDESTLTNNALTPETKKTYKLYITKTASNITIPTYIAISAKASDSVTTQTPLGTFTITLPKALDTDITTAKTIFGSSSGDYFTMTYYGTQFGGTDLATGTGYTITAKLTTVGTKATVTLYAEANTKIKTNAESAMLVSGQAAPIYMTLTDAGITAFGLSSGLETEFNVGTVTVSDK